MSSFASKISPTPMSKASPKPISSFQVRYGQCICMACFLWQCYVTVTHNFSHSRDMNWWCHFKCIFPIHSSLFNKHDIFSIMLIHWLLFLCMRFQRRNTKWQEILLFLATLVEHEHLLINSETSTTFWPFNGEIPITFDGSTISLFSCHEAEANENL